MSALFNAVVNAVVNAFAFSSGVNSSSEVDLPISTSVHLFLPSSANWYTRTWVLLISTPTNFSSVNGLNSFFTFSNENLVVSVSLILSVDSAW